jgi:uncharacterized phage protein (TIGR01671 family)
MKNRQIKFRFWNKSENRFYFFDFALINDSSNSGVGILGITLSGLETNLENNFVIQQFTGFIDKNKKDVYEGDIVEYVEGVELGDKMLERGVVKFEEYFGCFGYATALDKDCSNFPWEGVVSKATVIGNICENSELLNR